MDWNAQLPAAAAALVGVIVLVLLLRFMLRLAGCLLAVGLAVVLLVAVTRTTTRAADPQARHCPHLNAACVDAYKRTTWSRIEQSQVVRTVRQALGLAPIPVHAPEDPRWVDGPLRTPDGHIDPSTQGRYTAPRAYHRHHRSRRVARPDSTGVPAP
jgi:hypothetical protein